MLKLKKLAPIVLLGGAVVMLVYMQISRPASQVLAIDGIELTIDNQSYRNGALNPTTTWGLSDLDDGQGPGPDGSYLFFNFADIKPGDEGEDTISLHVQGGDYWACVDLSLTSDDDNSTNEPELTAGDDPEDPGDFFDGELGEGINFVFWADDGDNVLEDDENVFLSGNAQTVLDSDFAISDSTQNIYGPISPLTAGDTFYIAKAWCFGDLSQTPLAAGQGIDPSVDPGVTCDGSALGNLAQTDSLTADLSFLAVQSENNPGFNCQDCSIAQLSHLFDVIDSNQGLRRNGTPVLANRSNPNYVLGPPQLTNANDTFFSLGFGGTITVEFQDAVEDLAGHEFTFYEATNAPYPIESADVEVSQNGTDFFSIGTVTNVVPQPKTLDIAGVLPWIKFMRLTDTTNPNLFNNILDADGYDIDAIAASNQNICLN